MPKKTATLQTLPDPFLIDIEERISQDERVLFYLLKHPLQRMDDLALALSCHRSSISRHLTHLEESHLVERLQPSFGRTRTSVCWYLTTKGIEQVAAQVGAVPHRLAALWGANEAGLLRLLPRLSDLFVLQDIVNSLVEQAPRRLAPPGTLETPLRWHWQRDYHHTFVARNQRQRIRVDGAVVFARKVPITPEHATSFESREYSCAFLLQDSGWEGQENQARIKEQLLSLLRFRESAERWTHYHQFPPLLVLVTSERGLARWQRAAREAASQLRVAPLVGAVTVVQPEGSYVSCWNLPWQQLGDGGFCRIEALFPSMPKEAIPPCLLSPRVLPSGLFAPESIRTRSSIVTGQFEQRAHSELETGHRGPYEERAMLAWIGLHLTRKHEEILKQIAAHPLFSTQELAMLLGVEPATLVHHLTPLRRWRCIEPRSTEMGERLVLAERGLHLTAARLGVHLTHVAEARKRPSDPLVQRGVPYLLRTMRHTAGVYRFITHVHHTACEQGHKLLWWESGAQCSRRYRYRGSWHNLLPDARLAYQVGEHIMHAWLEWDEGTMRTPALSSKFSTDAHYINTRQWRLDEDRLPLLLMVVPDPGQEQRVQRLAATILQDLPLQVLTTTVTRLEREGPLAAIWLPLSSHDEQTRGGLVRQRWVGGQ
jgi:DNA-binding MarR family transcriptional regulator